MWPVRWFVVFPGLGRSQSCLRDPCLFHSDTKKNRVGQYPQCESFEFKIPTCWYLKTFKFALPPTRMLKFALPPTHVYFMLFVSISFALGTQRKPVFEWNMGLIIYQLGISRLQSDTVSLTKRSRCISYSTTSGYVCILSLHSDPEQRHVQNKGMN